MKRILASICAIAVIPAIAARVAHNRVFHFNPGYYDREMTCDRIISRLLMNGEVNADNTTAIDITSGRIHGVVNTSCGGKIRGDADIGLLNK